MERSGWTRAAALVAAIGMAAPVMAQSRTVEERVPLADGSRLEVDNERGSLDLRSWEGSDVEIQARIDPSPEGSPEAAAAAVEATQVVVERLGDAVVVRTDYSQVPRERTFWNGQTRLLPSVHYTIRAPRRIDLRLDLDRTDTTLDGFEGRIDLDVDRSEIDASNLTGAIRLSVDRGGRSRLAAFRGRIDVDADRTDLEMRDARFEDSSRISIDRGDVDIVVPADLAMSVEATISRRASFDSELPLTTRSFDERRISGTINGGGAALAIDADRSAIRLRGSTP